MPCAPISLIPVVALTSALCRCFSWENDERRHCILNKLHWIGRTKYLNMSEHSAKRFEVEEEFYF